MIYRYIKIVGNFLLLILVLVSFGLVVRNLALPPSKQIQTASYQPLAPDTPIYFRVLDRNRESVQVWVKNIGTIIEHPLMELPNQYPAIGLPIQELALLQREYCSDQQEDCSITDLSLGFGINRLRLSPDKQWLAWDEGASWCRGSGCYGLKNLVIWNVSRGERVVLLELPAHIDEIATNGIDRLSWSPDSKEIAFTHFSRWNGWIHIRVVDIETKQIRDLGDGRGPITWKPDGEELAFFTGEKTVKIISRDGTLQTTIDGGWQAVNNIDWSPDGSELVVTASTTSTIQANRFSIFIADLVTGDISELGIISDESRSYTHPRWSPNGEFIGVNYAPDNYSKLDGLTIFDPHDGTIIANLELERRQPEWLWSSDGSAILLSLNSPEGIGIFFWQEDRFEELQPPAALEEGIKNGQISIAVPVW